MKFKDKTIKNIAELIVAIREHTTSIDLPIWYRGHSNKKYKLIPELLRGSRDFNIKKELSFLCINKFQLFPELEKLGEKIKNIL